MATRTLTNNSNTVVTQSTIEASWSWAKFAEDEQKLTHFCSMKKKTK